MSDELDKDSTFFQTIEQNQDICSNCYRRLSYRLQPHHTLPDCVTEHLEYTSAAQSAHFGDEDNTGRPSVKRTYCECGDVDGSKIRPLSKSELMEVAVRVKDRLEEEQIDINEDDYFEMVRTLKSSPDAQFNEEKIIEKAVKISEANV